MKTPLGDNYFDKSSSSSRRYYSKNHNTRLFPHCRSRLIRRDTRNNSHSIDISRMRSSLNDIRSIIKIPVFAIILLLLWHGEISHRSSSITVTAFAPSVQYDHYKYHQSHLNFQHQQRQHGYRSFASASLGGTSIMSFLQTSSILQLGSNQNNHPSSQLYHLLSQSKVQDHLACFALYMSSSSNDSDSGENNVDHPNNNNNHTNSTLSAPRKKNRQKQQNKNKNGNNNNTSSKNKDDISSADLLKRLVQLERLASNQAVEIKRLKQDCSDLKEAATTFAQVVELLRQAGLTLNSSTSEALMKNAADEDDDDDEDNDEDEDSAPTSKSKRKKKKDDNDNEDSAEIFGAAPASVIDAADSAGSAILAAVLGGKLRMLVDVRDAELARDPDTLVQFIELAILPVAAGLEGLGNTIERNRVKIVFPTVAQLSQYRRTMALAAPEVVALSTLGCGGVEEQDNLVVVIAPSPDDEEGVAHLVDLLSNNSDDHHRHQPVVIINYHMVPLSGIIAATAQDFEKVYHLRLLSVQYMTGDMSPEYVQNNKGNTNNANKKRKKRRRKVDGSPTDTISGGDTNVPTNNDVPTADEEKDTKQKKGGKMKQTSSSSPPSSKSEEDVALEAAMEHAHQMGMNQGITRAMVIRAYPRPWHVFVDTSPDSDADFEVAATFDEEPSQEDVNYAIVECLEGSEREDELVAQQMQEALEAGQLNKISEMLGGSISSTDDEDEYDDDEYDLFNEDSV